jgi:hypothetical protein
VISEHVFNHEEVDDFTKDFTASPDQDYITLFIYPKGQEYDEITVEKNAAKAIVELFPHNFTKTTHRAYLTANGKILFPNPSTLPPYASLQIPSTRLSIGPQCPDSRNGQVSLIPR